MKVILASVYEINPYSNSEENTGWNFVYQIARFQKVIVATVKNNALSIEKYISENPDPIFDNISYIYFDLPTRMHRLKKGPKGAILYYWFWQRLLPNFIKKQNLHFDIVHNLNLHSDWMPSYLWKLNKPFVWGHVGHHPLIPFKFIKHHKISYFINDRMAWLTRKLFWELSPALKKTIKKSNHIICMNSSVVDVLDLKKETYSISPSVATKDYGCEQNSVRDKFTLITAGKMEPLKGFDLSIKAFAKFLETQTPESKPNCELIVVGSGPEFDSYLVLIHQLKIEKNVQMINWLPKKDLIKLFKNSSAFIFPSHEGAGGIVAEALSCELPIICLDNFGIGEYVNGNCGFTISANNYEQTVTELASAIWKLKSIPRFLQIMRISARQQFEQKFHWDLKGIEFHHIYSKL
jgi:glycosyltransferase involved in cell wall biosynthesis